MKIVDDGIEGNGLRGVDVFINFRVGVFEVEGSFILFGVNSDFECDG